MFVHKSSLAVEQPLFLSVLQQYSDFVESPYPIASPRLGILQFATGAFEVALSKS
jgi:hypothetical protein